MSPIVIIEGLSQPAWDARMQSWNEMIRAWDEEFARVWRQLIELNQQKVDELARQTAARREIDAAHEARRRRLQDEAEDAALNQSIAVTLEGLAALARSGEKLSIAVPANVRVSSTFVGGPSTQSMNALASDLESMEIGDPARHSAAWAIRHNFVPHLGDLGAMLTSLGVDRAWAHAFLENGHKIDRLEGGAGFRNVQLRALTGLETLRVVHEAVRLLDAYSPERVVRMVVQPRSLLDLPAKTGAPPQVGMRPLMGERRFHRMLDAMF